MNKCSPLADSRANPLENRIIYEDNHLIAVNKLCCELVQADRTGDTCLIDNIKLYLKEKYNKPNNVYLGLPHRLDRPTSGAVLFCKTEKALVRMNLMFSSSGVIKEYLCICDSLLPEKQGTLIHYLKRDSAKNKSFAYADSRPQTKRAELSYRLLSASDRYFLYGIQLQTGRHHQIRAQLAACGVHIRGDLKYGAKRSNPDGGIDLHSYRISFVHPVSKEKVDIKAPAPPDFDIFSFDS